MDGVRFCFSSRHNKKSTLTFVNEAGSFRSTELPITLKEEEEKALQYLKDLRTLKCSLFFQCLDLMNLIIYSSKPTVSNITGCHHFSGQFCVLQCNLRLICSSVFWSLSFRPVSVSRPGLFSSLWELSVSFCPSDFGSWPTKVYLNFASEFLFIRWASVSVGL